MYQRTRDRRGIRIYVPNGGCCCCCYDDDHDQPKTTTSTINAPLRVYCVIANDIENSYCGVRNREVLLPLPSLSLCLYLPAVNYRGQWIHFTEIYAAVTLFLNCNDRDSFFQLFVVHLLLAHADTYSDI